MPSAGAAAIEVMGILGLADAEIRGAGPRGRGARRTKVVAPRRPPPGE
jgi:hypothetical protein